LEFRAESFNTFNRPQFCAPQTVVGWDTFGQTTCTYNSPRELQMALKLYW
jgi:hypothetical protein